ncbi:MAG: GGDEF domain-containing protein [Arcobacter sp.]|nr:GGDEF domain-containing protein [Arcobacter sp.]
MQNINLLNMLLLATTFSTVVFIILYIRQLKNEKNICKQFIDNAKKEVEERLYKDELTGLKNRKSLEDSIKSKDSIVAILLDVDAFEDLNELLWIYKC